MTYRELARRLRNVGCEFTRQAEGSHEMWANPETQKLASIPNWGSKDLRMPTVWRIVRQLGISRSDFDRA